MEDTHTANANTSSVMVTLWRLCHQQSDSPGLQQSDQRQQTLVEGGHVLSREFSLTQILVQQQTKKKEKKTETLTDTWWCCAAKTSEQISTKTVRL